MIRVTCPNCKKALGIDDRFAGKKALCPACKTPIQLPRIDSATAQKPAEQLDVLEEVDELEEVEEEEVIEAVEDRSSPRDSRVQSGRRRAPRDDDDDDRPRRRSDEDDRRRRRDDDYEDDYEDDEPARKRPSRGSWYKAYQGLTMILNAIRIMVAGVVAYIAVLRILGFMGRASAAAGAGAGLMAAGGLALILGVLLLLLLLGCQVMWILGLNQCRSAPPRDGARACATIAMFLSCGVIFCHLGTIFLPPLMFVGTILYLATMIVFLFFLRAAARKAGNSSLVNTTIPLALGLGFCAISWIVMAFMTLVAAAATVVGGAGAADSLRGGLDAAGMVTCVSGLLSLILGIWYLIFIGQVRTALEEHLFPG
jgi:hypothetical protein